MTKTYELPNEKMIMADVDEKHHTATISVYALDDLVETVNKTGHWIPVSESLPKKSGNYLITYCLQDEIETQEAVYYKDEEEDKWFDITDIEITLAVIAWMPLPKPYKVESEE